MILIKKMSEFGFALIVGMGLVTLILIYYV
jgi:hypothetical protein